MANGQVGGGVWHFRVAELQMYVNIVNVELSVECQLSKLSTMVRSNHPIRLLNSRLINFIPSSQEVNKLKRPIKFSFCVFLYSLEPQCKSVAPLHVRSVQDLHYPRAILQTSIILTLQLTEHLKSNLFILFIFFIFFYFFYYFFFYFIFFFFEGGRLWPLCLTIILGAITQQPWCPQEHTLELNSYVLSPIVSPL